MGRPVKILLGGVPFGRNNVGDEAILECVVKLLRSSCPAAEICVSTDDAAGTRETLGVETVQLFGFKPPYSHTLMVEHLTAADVFIWAGATGLSDYPEIPLSMLEIAHAAGTKTVVWGVGMSDELNPFLYKLMPGRRRRLLAAASWLTGRKIDFVRRVEVQNETRAKNKIAQQLRLADLVVLRNPESRKAVQACGAVPGMMIGADSALLLEPDPWEAITLPPNARAMLESGTRKIGLCISAQRELVHQDELIRFLDQLADRDYRIVFLPMNHTTDAPLMERLRERLQNKVHSVVIDGRRRPGEILAIAGRLDLVISSRLHLLIFASLVNVPIIGISRGSKVDNFLAPFDYRPAGSVEDCDFEHMQAELDRLIDSQAEFQEDCEKVQKELLERLDKAQRRLAALLESC